MMPKPYEAIIFMQRLKDSLKGRLFRKCDQIGLILKVSDKVIIAIIRPPHFWPPHSPLPFLIASEYALRRPRGSFRLRKVSGGFLRQLRPRAKSFRALSGLSGQPFFFPELPPN
jgi:hypothetical protein